MDKEAQRIAIAEACGWSKSVFSNFPTQMQRPNTDVDSVATIPDYLNDLNAMHEAEKVLTDEQYESFAKLLLSSVEASITEKEFPNYEERVRKQGRAVLSAAAARRAQPFLRALRLWKD